jgi:hypothetical protein
VARLDHPDHPDDHRKGSAMTTPTNTPSTPKFPQIEVTIDLKTWRGNAFYILETVMKQLLEHTADVDLVDEYLRNAQQWDYQHLLKVTREYVTFHTIN